MSLGVAVKLKDGAQLKMTMLLSRVFNKLILVAKPHQNVLS